MLAIYDSQDNQLRQNETIDRSLLYNNLLRRFIEREIRKDKRVDQREFESLMEYKMMRLGVAALGMYNRGKVHISKGQLNNDLVFFKEFIENGRTIEKASVRPFGGTGGRPLDEAEGLLGGFFFVQESQAVYKDQGEQGQTTDTAFEFLHKTFGEFLTADFILRQALEATRSIYRLRIDEESANELRKWLGKVDSLSNEWFACLIYMPLFTAPETLAMMQEWLKHRLEKRNRTLEDFFTDLDLIIESQLMHLLTGNSFPAMMTAGASVGSSFESLPLLGHLAIYSLNLILLRVVLANKTYILDEASILPISEAQPGPWDRLTYLWRSYFPLRTLNNMSGILVAQRRGSMIHLSTSLQRMQVFSRNPISVLANVSRTIADHATVGLVELLQFDPMRDPLPVLKQVEQDLTLAGIIQPLHFPLLIKLLRASYVHRDRRTISLLADSLPNIMQPAASWSIEDGIQLVSEFARAPNDLYAELQLGRLGNEIMRLMMDAVLHKPDVPLVLTGELLRVFRQLNERVSGDEYRYTERIHRSFVLQISESFRRRVYSAAKKSDRSLWDLRILSTPVPIEVPIEIAVELIPIAKELRGTDLLEYIYHVIRQNVNNIQNVQIGVLPNLYWLAAERQDNGLLNFIEQLTRENPFMRPLE